MSTVAQNWACRVVLLLAAGLALANAGCLVVAAGAGAAGAGAVGYAYLRGQFYRDYPADLPNTAAAVHTALTELQMPIDAEDQTSFESRTGDGNKVRIRLEPQTAAIPAEGTSTRVSVRVGSFGDEDVARRILDQIGTHLGPPAGAPVASAARPTAAARPPETAPPPLASPAANPAATAIQHVKTAETAPPPLAPPTPVAAPAK
jgi:hypothetical protein